MLMTKVLPCFNIVCTSLEKAKGGDLFPEGAEIYFGHIDSWEEFTASNIAFDKNIVFGF